MIGYKGVVLKNGILRSKYGDIFEVDIPREYQEVDDGVAFTECGYSFCGTIEEVVCHENFIMSLEHRRIRDVRLFEVDTLDEKVIGKSYHYKASRIKLVREVSKNEIIKYFEDNILAKQRLIRQLKKEKKCLDIYDKYCSEEYEEYRIIEDADEIEDLYVHSCMQIYQENLCKQNNLKYLKISNCESCFGYKIRHGPKTYVADYLYLLARRKLNMGLSLNQIDEYLILTERGYINEVNALKILNNYR